MQTQSIKTIEFERPQMHAGISCVANAWARVPAALPSAADKAALKERIRRLLKERQAVLVAHY
ncbi:MAG TPA: quinolinate synthase NadA, partial [Nitrosospira sp.]|nr:quinolinate synthase NadA [Nitrosospira sp.]